VRGRCGALKKDSQGIEVCLQRGGELKLHIQQISLALNLGLFLFGEALLLPNHPNRSKDLVIVDQSRLLARSGNEARQREGPHAAATNLPWSVQTILFPLEQC